MFANRSASSDTTLHSSSGRASYVERIGPYGMASTSDGSRARASAVRPRSRNSPISPKASPRSIKATTDSRPSIYRLAMARRPDTTTNSSGRFPRVD